MTKNTQIFISDGDKEEIMTIRFQLDKHWSQNQYEISK
jgi:hypothetical protein